MAVVAIGGDLLVALLGGAHQAHHHGFLPDIEMAEAADQTHAIELTCPILEASDQKHVVIELFQGFGVAFGGFGHVGGLPFLCFGSLTTALLQAARNLASALLFYCAAPPNTVRQSPQSCCGKAGYP